MGSCGPWHALTPEEHYVTQAQIDEAVALATGETIREVEVRGFSLEGDCPEAVDPDDLALVLDAPSYDVEAKHALHTACIAGKTAVSDQP